MKNALNWFEIPASDFERAVKFYNHIFDTAMYTSVNNDYKMAFLPMESPGVGGAIVNGPNRVPTLDGALVYLNGQPDLQVVLDRIEPAGGKIIMDKSLIAPELGYMAIFIDSEGNKVALHSMS